MTVLPARKRRLPKRAPDCMMPAIKELKKLATKEQCLERAYHILAEKFYGDFSFSLYNPHKLFFFSVENAWQSKKKIPLHSVHINYLLRILLVKSGHFLDQDLWPKITHLYVLFPHQYMWIWLADKQKVQIVDIWAEKYGIPFGHYATGWHYDWR